MMRIRTIIEITGVTIFSTLILIFILEQYSMIEDIVEVGQRVEFDTKAITEKMRATNITLYEKLYNKLELTENEDDGIPENMRKSPLEINHSSAFMVKYRTIAKEQGPLAYFQHLFTKFTEEATDKALKDQYEKYQNEILETAIINLIALCYSMKGVPDIPLHDFKYGAFDTFIELSKDLTQANSFFPIEEFKNISLVGMNISRLPINALEFFNNAVGIELLVFVYVYPTNNYSFRFSLKNLKRLRIHETLLSDIPCIEGLVNLEVLDIRHNIISNIQLSSYDVDDEDFKPMYHVKCIDLRSNPLMGGDAEKIYQVFPKLESILIDDGNDGIEILKANLTHQYSGKIVFSAPQVVDAEYTAPWLKNQETTQQEVV